nr:hypothetical protein [Eubacterium sp.]
MYVMWENSNVFEELLIQDTDASYKDSNYFYDLYETLLNKSYSTGFEFLGKSMADYFSWLKALEIVEEEKDNDLDSYDELIALMYYHNLSDSLVNEFEMIINNIDNFDDYFDLIENYFEKVCVYLYYSPYSENYYINND